MTFFQSLNLPTYIYNFMGLDILPWLPNTRPKAKPAEHPSKSSPTDASLPALKWPCLVEDRGHMVSDAHFRHGAAHSTQTREHISHTAARSKRSEPKACPIPPVRTHGLSYPTGSCCRALPIITFLSSAFLSSPVPSSKSLLAFSLPAHPSILAAHDTYTSQAH